MLSWLFGKKKDETDIFKLVTKILDDEEYQINLSPNAALIKQGKSIDQIEGGAGPFGCPTNPIPVNGPLGEMTYLSRLRTMKNEQLFFHRIGAISSFDLFELVSISGNEWHILALHMYHPRRSRLVPDNFKLVDEISQFSGFTHFCKNFPYDFEEEKNKKEHGDAIALAYIPSGLLNASLVVNNHAIKPEKHLLKLKLVNEMQIAYSSKNNDRLLELLGEYSFLI